MDLIPCYGGGSWGEYIWTYEITGWPEGCNANNLWLEGIESNWRYRRKRQHACYSVRKDTNTTAYNIAIISCIGLKIDDENDYAPDRVTGQQQQHQGWEQKCGEVWKSEGIICPKNSTMFIIISHVFRTTHKRRWQIWATWSYFLFCFMLINLYETKGANKNRNYKGRDSKSFHLSEAVWISTLVPSSGWRTQQ